MRIVDYPYHTSCRRGGTMRRRRKQPARKKGPGDTDDSSRDAHASGSKESPEALTKTDTTVDLSPQSISIICAAVGFILYANAVFVCDFCYDDIAAIVRNSDVLNSKGDGVMSSWVDFWKNDYWGTDVHSEWSHKSYRPLVILTFRLDALISKNAWIFHLSNALLFALTCWLVVKFALLPSVAAPVGVDGGHNGSKQEQPRTMQPRKTVVMETILLSGLWFVAHPIHTESVTSIVGRAEILAAILCLIGSHLHRLHRACQLEGKRGSWASAASCFFAACLCKETAVVIPVVLAAMDVAATFFSPKTVASTKEQSRRVAACLGRTVVLVAASFGYLSFRSWLFAGTSRGSTLTGAAKVEDNFMQKLGPMDKLRTALYIQAKYVQLLLWPNKLSCDYSLGVVTPVREWASLEVMFAITLAAAVVALAWHGLTLLRRTGDTTVLLALGWTFAPLFPASHIVSIGTVMAERLLFMPSIGVVMLLCYGVSRMAEAYPNLWRPARMALTGCAIFFAMKTMLRNEAWRDTAHLMETDLETYPGSFKLLMSNARGSIDPGEREFKCAQTAMRVLERYSMKDVAVDESTEILAIMAMLKTAPEKWPEGYDPNGALTYANRVIEVGHHFGDSRWATVHETKGRALLFLPNIGSDKALLKEALDALEVAIEMRRKVALEDKKKEQPTDKHWSSMYDNKGTALLKLGAVTGNQTILKDASSAFQMAFEYHSLPESCRFHCMSATALMLLKQNVEAKEKFDECFRLEALGEKTRVRQSEHFSDRKNYALLMKTLSGIDSRDAAAVSKWGEPAVAAIETVLAFSNESGYGKWMAEADLKYFTTVRNNILEFLRASDNEE